MSKKLKVRKFDRPMVNIGGFLKPFPDFVKVIMNQIGVYRAYTNEDDCFMQSVMREAKISKVTMDNFDQFSIALSNLGSGTEDYTPEAILNHYLDVYLPYKKSKEKT